MSKTHLQIAFWLVNIFSIIDAIFTLIFTQLYGVAEANPIWASALEYSPYLFTVFKLAIVFLCSYSLYHNAVNSNRRIFAGFGLYGVAGFYVLFSGFHLYGLCQILSL